MVEDHAEQLTESLIIDLKQNARTPEYHKLTYEHELASNWASAAVAG